MRRFYYVASAWVVEGGGRFFSEHRFVRLYRSLMPMFPEAVLLGCDASSYSHSVFQPVELAPLSAGLPNVNVRLLPMQGTRLGRAIRQGAVLWRELVDADLVGVDMPSETGFLAVLVCKLRRKAFFVQILGDWGRSVLFSGPPTVGRRIKAAIGKWMARFVVRHSPLVFTQGKDLYNNYVQQNPAAVKNCLRSTLGHELFHERSAEPFHAPTRLLSVSALVRLKGLDMLPRAVRLISARGIRVEWWCVGDGPYRRPLEDLAAALDISDRVKFLGWVPLGPKLYQIYKQADIFVLPSLTEGVPNALLEAMAHSLPVVASRVGGVPGVITDGVDGVLVEPGRPDLIADAICALIGNLERVTQMRRAAFTKAQEYASDVLAERSKRLIESTFGRIDQVENYARKSFGI